MDRLRIAGGCRLQGKVTIGGSKNASLPLMVASLLAETPTTLTNTPNLRDTETMVLVLTRVGASVRFIGNQLFIDPQHFSVAEAPYDMVRKMRASIYVMGPMLARLGHCRVSLPGGCAIGARPIDLHLKGFEALGVHITRDRGYIVAKHDGLRGAEFSLEGPAGSSVGATCNVLMAAVLAKGTSVMHGAAREPEVVDLINFLNAMGAHIEGAGESTLTIEGVDRLRGVEYAVIPDRIEAGTYMAAAAITKGDVLIENCEPAHLTAVIEKFREIGVEVEAENGGLRVRSDGNFRPASIRTLPYPGFPTDLQAQFMVLVALAPGVSTIVETIYPQRFMHAMELVRMGAEINLTDGKALVEGVPTLSGAPVMASDLRASAALVLAGLAAKDETEVLRVYHIDRGYEQIDEKLSALGAQIERIGTPAMV
ncbi:MAG: UDP-N-acetylglucosamine 1-carboxyvinyltransferase [bacterium]